MFIKIILLHAIIAAQINCQNDTYYYDYGSFGFWGDYQAYQGNFSAESTNFTFNYSTESVLQTVLMKGYNKTVRPQAITNITTRISLKQIISLDEKNQILSSSVFFSQKWTDPRLAWNVTEYSYITTLKIPSKNIWVPDTIILNSADGEGFVKIPDSSLATVSYTGMVFLIVPVVLMKTRCSLNMRAFPFDEQMCRISMASWVQGPSRILYQWSNKSSLDISEYIENSIWQLYDNSLVLETAGNRDPFETDASEDIIIEIYLKRKPLYYMLNTVFPCLVLNVLSIFAFFMPYVVQISLSMTCFLTYSVNSVRISNDMPIQSDYVPIITVYFVFSISFAMLVMVWFIVCNQFSSKETMPLLLTRLAEAIQRATGKCTKERNKVSDLEKDIKVEDVEINKGDGKQSNDEQRVLTLEKLRKDCNFCGRCDKCVDESKKEKEKIEKKKEFERKVTIINYCMLIVAVLMMLSCQLAIWLSFS